MMNRQMRRLSEKEGRKLMAKGWNEFREVSGTELAIASKTYRKAVRRPDKFYQNNMYSAQVYYGIKRKGKVYTKVMVRRNDAKPILSWSDLYRIKNEIFGEEIEAVQFLPPKSELTDVANLYWFWIEETKQPTKE